MWLQKVKIMKEQEKSNLLEIGAGWVRESKMDKKPYNLSKPLPFLLNTARQ
jgi:hypothetical protein